MSPRQHSIDRLAADNSRGNGNAALASLENIREILARPAGFEPATKRIEASCSNPAELRAGILIS